MSTKTYYPLTKKEREELGRTGAHPTTLKIPCTISFSEFLYAREHWPAEPKFSMVRTEQKNIGVLQDQPHWALKCYSSGPHISSAPITIYRFVEYTLQAAGNPGWHQCYVAAAWYQGASATAYGRTPLLALKALSKLLLAQEQKQLQERPSSAAPVVTSERP